ncbi:hypothetical protein SKAU_G00392220 [Synaphobranchus kaupii]|uniref:Uncharacterized protein n=1 Tax=Synaphobranchus kaupii TaxID=118154 RepID=A0A9Q1ICW2_SYNKA|nr:hypothetical protein SKAU_G00392220 [Synaphobranchus kaupii]
MDICAAASRYPSSRAAQRSGSWEKKGSASGNRMRTRIVRVRVRTLLEHLARCVPLAYGKRADGDQCSLAITPEPPESLAFEAGGSVVPRLVESSRKPRLHR